jgi:hypothetical protein
LILGLPSLAALALGLAIGTVVEWGFVVDALAAVALVLPVTLLTHTVTERWRRRDPAGAFYGMLIGVVLRAVAIIGGGAALFLGTDEFAARGASLWAWVIGVYLSTLAVELAELVRRLRRGCDSTR